jgi:hypothetical protein
MSTTHSNYWLDRDLFNDDAVVETDRLDINRIARLAAVRRAVANFVSILSGKNVPVQYSAGKQSYTDGQTVVISAEDDPEKFDVMVGLALHEGSHILLSDFHFLQAVHGLIGAQRNGWGENTYWTVNGNAILSDKKTNMLRTLLPEKLFNALGEVPMASNDDPYWDKYWTAPFWTNANKMLTDLKDIMNILEDRRIDKYVYQNAQGYRPYYDALYAKYFFTAEIGKNLRFNPEWRELTIENYINRILLSIHPASKPDALPGLEYMLQLVDLSTIDRVAPVANDVFMTKVPSFNEAPRLWQDACNIYAAILAYTGLHARQKETEQGDDATPSNGKSQGMSDNVLNGLTSDLPNLDSKPLAPTPVEKDVKGKGAKAQEVDGKFNDKKAEKEIQNAKNIMNGMAKKKVMKKAEKDAVDALETADAKMVDLKGDGIKNGKCMVLRKVTKALLKQDWFLFGRNWRDQNLTNAVAAGRRMGELLHHRLQVRNDPMMTKQTRLPHGGLDRRLLAQLGMEITSVFQKSRVDTHKPVVLHLSLDASGSMSGKKWQKVVTVATAIAYLSSKLQNVDAVISLRGGNDMPLVAILFDSRKDVFPNFVNTIQELAPAGATPEGLAFKATLDLVLENADSHDVYFINFSDGEPAFSWRDKASDTYVNYSGEFAATHTRTQIRTMREAGVKVLSYFITDTDYVNPGAKRLFNTMYGDSASFVNVQNAGEVLRTLNKLLLNRGT